MRIAIRLTAALAAVAWLAGSAAAADEVSASRRTAVVRAIERVQPAVVSIHVTYRERVMVRNYSRDPFFELFAPFYLLPGERERTSSGSGFIVSPAGHVLTNAHVVGDPQRVERIDVSLADGRSLSAAHVATDNSFDLAVLQVKGTGLPFAPLGDSDHILVGEWAIAIGNPFDLGPTACIGLVSALDRDFAEPQGSANYFYRNMIQTDAAINPGNSGGPLVNADGEVIGVNSFIYTGSEYNMGSIGIGFAIPINTARVFLDEVREHGQVRRPWHGIVYLQDLTQALAEHLSLPSREGALVVQVAPFSPAAAAGLERGDVITAIGGERVRNTDDAISILKGLRVDDLCTMTVLRYGQSLQLVMRLVERPAGQQAH